MPIIASNFTKISGERTETKQGQINIKNSANIKDVHKTKLAIGQGSQDVLRVMFEFITNYEPNRGRILIEGDIIYTDKADKIEAAMKSWQKDKKLPKDEARMVINHVLSKCNIEAILMSRELNLPSPVELPRIAAK